MSTSKRKNNTRNRSNLFSVALTVICITGLGLSNASAALLLGWDADQASFSDRIESVETHPDLNSSTLSTGDGVGFAQTSDDHIRIGPFDGDQTSSRNDGDYFSFTIQPSDPAKRFNVDSISWHHWSSSSAEFQLMADFDDDGYEIDDEWDSDDILSTRFEPPDSDLVWHDPAFDDIGVSDHAGELEFRIYGFYGGNQDRIQEDGSSATDFEVHGTVVPEPSTLAMLGLAGLLLMKRRRRRA